MIMIMLLNWLFILIDISDILGKPLWDLNFQEFTVLTYDSTFLKQFIQQFYISSLMISLKLIKKEQYDQLVLNDTHFLEQINQLYDDNTIIAQHLQQTKSQNSQLMLKNDALLLQNQNYLKQIHDIKELLSQKSAQCINLKSTIQTYKAYQNETTIQMSQLKATKNQIQIRFADMKNSIKSYKQDLVHQLSKNQQYQMIIRKLESDISSISQANSCIQQKYGILQQELQKQIQRNEKLKLQIQKQSYQKCLLQERVSKINQLPEAQLKQKLTANEEWIKQLTKQYSELKQKFVEKEVEKQRFAAFNSGNVTYQSKHQDFQRAKYIQLCKNLLHQFNARLQKIQKQKMKMENKYKIISLKLNEYQYQQFKYKDKISLYIQKIEGYQKLATKQQNQLQKIINQFDKELENVVKLKQSQMQNKIQELDTFQLQLLSKQVEVLRCDLKKLKKEKKKNAQTIVLLQQENYSKTIQLRKIKRYNQDLITQLQIRTTQVQFLKAKISSNGSHTNRSQQELLSTISRLSNKNTNGKLSSGQDKYEYQISQIDTQNQRKNEELLRYVSPRKYYKSNPGIPDLIAEHAKRLQQSLISQSSSSNSNDSSQCLSSDQSLNESVVSKGSSKSYAMKQNYSYKSKLNPNSKFLLHKNSLN